MADNNFRPFRSRDTLAREDIDEVVNACDAGREGELIFAYLYEKAKAKKPVKRLWLNSMTAAAMRDAFASLRPAEEFARLEQAVSFANRLFVDAPRLSDFFGVLDTVPSVRDRASAVNPGRMHGHVEFEDVSFSYDGKRPTVVDLTFKALPGDRIALVGPTGSGKSTALALLYRAFDPQSGAIAIDGTDIRDLKLIGLRRNIGVVFQETLLFNRSIAENLRVGKPDATDAEIRDAAARAQALEFIERNPEGFEARVGERGRLLSGGERQRLAIARALLSRPRLLMLDEPSLGLAPTVVAQVYALLKSVREQGVTILLIEQNARSALSVADQAIVLSLGRVELHDSAERLAGDDALRHAYLGF